MGNLIIFLLSSIVFVFIVWGVINRGDPHDICYFDMFDQGEAFENLCPGKSEISECIKCKYYVGNNE